MIISEKLKLVFIHNPKTGGTFIWSVLRRLDPKLIVIRTKHQTHHSYPDDHLELIKKYKVKGFCVFTVIRNPKDSIVSYYNYIKTTNPDHNLHKLCQSMSLEQFIKHESDKLPDYIYQSYVHQKPFLYSHGVLIPDVVICYDNLVPKFRTILENQGVKPMMLKTLSFDPVNKSNKGEVLTDEMFQQLLKNNRKFQEDFDLYQYFMSERSFSLKTKTF